MQCTVNKFFCRDRLQESLLFLPVFITKRSGYRSAAMITRCGDRRSSYETYRCQPPLCSALLGGVRSLGECTRDREIEGVCLPRRGLYLCGWQSNWSGQSNRQAASRNPYFDRGELRLQVLSTGCSAGLG